MTLHQSEAVGLVELWLSIRNYIPMKDQRSAAEQFISTIDDAGLVELGMNSNELFGTCEVFDKALRTYCRENGLYEEVEEAWDE